MLAPKEHPMTDLSSFPITKKWPAQHPDRLQLYSLNTPNGVKASIMRCRRAGVQKWLK